MTLLTIVFKIMKNGLTIYFQWYIENGSNILHAHAFPASISNDN